MKTKTLTMLAGAMLFAGRSLLAGEVAAESPAGGLPQPEAPHACCPREPAPVAVAPVSDRSIYQLESVWTNDADQRMTLASLRGRPVVIAMFFASCSYACPILVSDLQRVREGLPAEMREQAAFVLVSFDTVRDTPAALRAYRARTGLPAEQWTLLHGGPEQVQELAMLLGVKYKQDAKGEFAHSNLITVLNAGGEIVHQKNGLQGDVSGAVKALVAANLR